NRHGEISLQGEDFKRQRQALLAEGITFKQGKVDLEKYGWKW
ncbi:methyltransferase, partial [Rahnella perminowiae]|nr:methyltransferase [Rahnella perminowiae]